MSLLTEGIY